MHPCGSSLVELKVNLARVCGSFAWSGWPKHGVFIELDIGGSRGTCGGPEGFGGCRGTAGKTLGEMVSENNCAY